MPEENVVNPTPQAPPAPPAPVPPAPPQDTPPADGALATPETPGGVPTPKLQMTQNEFDRIIENRLARQKAALTPQIEQKTREAAAAEYKPQLDELTALKQAQMTEAERVAAQVASLTEDNTKLAQDATRASRDRDVAAVLLDRKLYLPSKFWGLVQGNTPDEMAESIEAIREELKEAFVPPTPPPPPNGEVPPAATPQVPALGSPSSPPAVPNAANLVLTPAERMARAVAAGDGDQTSMDALRAKYYPDRK